MKDLKEKEKKKENALRRPIQQQEEGLTLKEFAKENKKKLQNKELGREIQKRDKENKKYLE